MSLNEIDREHVKLSALQDISDYFDGPVSAVTLLENHQEMHVLSILSAAFESHLEKWAPLGAKKFSDQQFLLPDDEVVGVYTARDIVVPYRLRIYLRSERGVQEDDSDAGGLFSNNQNVNVEIHQNGGCLRRISASCQSEDWYGVDPDGLVEIASIYIEAIYQAYEETVLASLEAETTNFIEAAYRTLRALISESSYPHVWLFMVQSGKGTFYLDRYLASHVLGSYSDVSHDGALRDISRVTYTDIKFQKSNTKKAVENIKAYDFELFDSKYRAELPDFLTAYSRISGSNAHTVVHVGTKGSVRLAVFMPSSMKSEISPILERNKQSFQKVMSTYKKRIKRIRGAADGLSPGDGWKKSDSGLWVKVGEVIGGIMKAFTQA